MKFHYYYSAFFPFYRSFWILFFMTFSITLGIRFFIQSPSTALDYHPNAIKDIAGAYFSTYREIFDIPGIPDRIYPPIENYHYQMLSRDMRQILYAITALKVYPEQFMDYLPEFVHNINLVAICQMSIIPAHLAEELEPVFADIQNATTSIKLVLPNLVNHEGLSDYHNPIIADSIIQIHSSLDTIFRDYGIIYRYLGRNKEQLIESFRIGYVVFRDHSWSDSMSYLHVVAMQNPFYWWLEQ